MKLLVIGAGTVGRHLARTAADIPPFTEIQVADRQHERAANVASSIGGSPVQLDAADHALLVSAMRSADVVASAIGPSTRFGMPTLRAAIEAGRPYAEIGDDPRPTLAMLGLDAEARAAGVTAVLGLGASPGIANMLAVEAGSRLDRVDRILTGWGSAGEQEDEDDSWMGGEVTAALEHWVEQAAGTVPILKDGRIVEGKPLAEVTVDYPGIGRVRTRTIGHPEPVTLQRRFPELRDALNVMDFPSYIFASLERAARMVDDGASPKQGAEFLIKLLRDEPDDALLSRKAASYAWYEARDRLSGKRWLPPLWALAEGMMNGGPARVAASLTGQIPGGMGPMTGVPAAVTLAMLAAGKVECGPGVHTIETAVTPDAFFARLAHFLIDADGARPRSPVTLIEELK